MSNAEIYSGVMVTLTRVLSDILVVLLTKNVRSLYYLNLNMINLIILFIKRLHKGYSYEPAPRVKATYRIQLRTIRALARRAREDGR